MVGEFFGVVPRPPEALQPRRRCLMLPRPLSARDLAIRDIAEQDVAERILGALGNSRARRTLHELPALELPQPRMDRGLIGGLQSGHARSREAVPQHRRILQEAPVSWR